VTGFPHVITSSRSDVLHLPGRGRLAARERGGVHDLVAHPRGAAEAEAAGRRGREVERALAHERPPVVDADDDGLPVPLVLDADERAEGERAVGRREGVVVVTLAAGGTAALEGAGVAAGDA